MFTDFNLYICIFTSKSLVRLNATTHPTAKQVKDMGYFASSTYGNRIDVLCDCVDRILNRSDKIKGVGDVLPASENHMAIYSPNSNFYGKCLKYRISNYNGGGSCGN